MLICVVQVTSPNHFVHFSCFSDQYAFPLELSLIVLIILIIFLRYSVCWAFLKKQHNFDLIFKWESVNVSFSPNKYVLVFCKYYLADFYPSFSLVNLFLPQPCRWFKSAPHHVTSPHFFRPKGCWVGGDRAFRDGMGQPPCGWTIFLNFADRRNLA